MEEYLCPSTKWKKEAGEIVWILDISFIWVEVDIYVPSEFFPFPNNWLLLIKIMNLLCLWSDTSLFSKIEIDFKCRRFYELEYTISRFLIKSDSLCVYTDAVRLYTCLSLKN